MGELVSVEVIASKIFIIRGKKVMVDKDLAELYVVETKQLIRQVKRNISRFPSDFMFQLTEDEAANLRCQFGTSSWGGRRYLPFVFTQEGVAMLSGVLHSKRAIQVNIQIMRAFISLRHALSVYKNFERKLRELEERIEGHDADIHDIFEAIRQLIGIPEAKKIIKGFAQK